jgi:hypothetical protein
MREKLNSNPLLQAAVIGVLLVSAGFFLLSTMGGGSEEESEAGLESTTTTVTTSVDAGDVASPAAALSAALSIVNAASSDAPPPPRPVVEAWEANKTIVLLFVRDGGIDDRLVVDTTGRLGALPGVAVFVVPARQIFRYAAIAEGVGVERVPALVVVRPKNLNQQLPTASVSYGYQTPQSVAQAVIDAGYKGPTIDYHP